MYQLVISEACVKQLKKLDKTASVRIVKWLKRNIDGADDPRLFGKCLKGNLRDQWRYRIGSYRVIAVIDDNKFIVVTVKIALRKDICR